MTHLDPQRRAEFMNYLQQVLILADRDPDIAEFLHSQLHEILVYARLRGLDIDIWSENLDH